MADYSISQEINGNITFSCEFFPSKPNNVFLEKLEEFWLLVDDDDVEYRIVFCQTKSYGNKMAKRIKAIPRMYDDLDVSRVYERYTGSYSMDELLKIIFEDTDYSYRVIGTWTSIRIEGFGDGDTRLKMLQRVLNRYDAEFEFLGNSVTIRERIGRDTDIMFRHRLNASDIQKEVDGQEFYTFARGYGDYDDIPEEEREDDKQPWEYAKLIREYTSPMQSLIGIKREAPPVKNGNIKLPDRMDEALKKVVDSSIKIILTAKLADLRYRNYKQAQAKLGDKVHLIDERIKLEEVVRVVKSVTHFDWKGKVKDIDYTLGSQDVVDRYNATLSNAVKDISDLFEGRKKLPFEAMAHEVELVTKLLTSRTSEIFLNEKGAMLAVDKQDPNNVVIFNSAGLGISDDGGKTFKNAITSRGIVADAIIANSITADKLAANAIVVGFNSSSTNLKLWSDRIEFFSNNRKTAELDDRGMTFWYGSRQIGDLGEGYKTGYMSVRGIHMRLHTEGDFISWSHLKSSSDTSYTTMMTMDPYGLMTGWQGIDVSMKMRVVDNNGYGHQLHDALQVGSQFKGLNLSIPSRINSDGSIAEWYNFSF